VWFCTFILQVMLSNVTFYYPNPSTLDTCEQFIERTVFSLEQLISNGGLQRISPVSFQVDSWEVAVQVVDGIDNSTGTHAQQGQLASCLHNGC
jgi:hypothetical protein